MEKSQKSNVAIEIINLLAEKKCTAEDADDIICEARRSLLACSTVQHLDFQA